MTMNKRTRDIHNEVKHFILNILSAVFLILSITEMLGGIEILGESFRETGDIIYIVMLIPVILIGVTLFIISSRLLNYKTRYDKEQIEAELGFKGNDDFNKLSYEQLIERYSVDYDIQAWKDYDRQLQSRR